MHFYCHLVLILMGQRKYKKIFKTDEQFVTDFKTMSPAKQCVKICSYQKLFYYCYSIPSAPLVEGVDGLGNLRSGIVGMVRRGGKEPRMQVLDAILRPR